MKSTIGRNQSYCREINFELVLDLLRKQPYSATQLSETLQLSNATMSSIVKELLELGMIKIAQSLSVKGSGRKQVFYTLNEKYGLILIVNIAHKTVDISITNIKEELIASETMAISAIDEGTIQGVILKASQLLFECHDEAPLKNIIISITGLVKDKTEGGQKHFVQEAFEKQFQNIPTYLTNDGNLITYAEISKGVFSKENNGMVVLVDYGIGGAFVIDKQLFRGDNGFSGEMGHILCDDNGDFQYLEDAVSLRRLLEKAEPVVGHKVKMGELFDLYKKDERIHKLVIDSARVLGKSLKSLIEVMDISNVVLAGRVQEFGQEYLDEVRKGTDKCLFKPNVVFSPLGYKGQMIGGAFIGVDYILKKH